MLGSETNGCWHELARVRAPVGARTLWTALLDKTEHPERYNPTIRRAQLLDHDPTVVLRRTFPASGKPFDESVRHACRERRVEYQRHGFAWKTAQAIVVHEDETWLVYEVDDPQAALADAGISANHAQRTLDYLVTAASTGVDDPLEESWGAYG